jgi:cell division protein FtsN
MAENRKERDKRFYFSRVQMIVLGAAFALASAAIFFLGIFVGKSIEARKMVNPEQPLVRFPIKPGMEPSASASEGATKDDQAVFETGSKPALAQTVSEEKPQEARPTDSATKPELAEKKASVSPSVPAKTADKTVDKAPPIDTSKKVTTDQTDAKDANKAWRVQVNAYPDEQSAKQLVDRLKNKSYNAYVTEAKQKGKTWYRVSVGKYSSREEADKVLESLKSNENFANAFATSR